MSSPQLCTHEIFTPLFAIDGALEMLLDGSAGELPGDVSCLLQDISSASRELNAQIRILADIARLGHNADPYRSLHPVSSLAGRFGLVLHADEPSLVIEIDTNEFAEFLRKHQEITGSKTTVGRFVVRGQACHLEFEMPQKSEDNGSGEGSLYSFWLHACAARIGFTKIERKGDVTSLSVKVRCPQTCG